MKLTLQEEKHEFERKLDEVLLKLQKLQDAHEGVHLAPLAFPRLPEKGTLHEMA